MSALSRLDRTGSSRSMRFRPNSRITAPWCSEILLSSKTLRSDISRVSRVPYRLFATRSSPRIRKQTSRAIAVRLRGN